MAVVTLLTDFGNQDYFVAAMKGVILSINPSVQIIDITHEVPPQDIQSAAFTLLACYRDFPAGTIHVCVVDPGVGSKRRALAVRCAQQLFVGPDNGIFSWVWERERDYRAHAITNEKFFRPPVSTTFHGRDVFAPVAAALSARTKVEELGEPVADVVRLPALAPQFKDDTIEGRVIHIDRFGNCVTNLTRDHLSEQGFARGAKLIMNDQHVSKFHACFTDARDDEPFCFFGSAGFLEIGARNSSAKNILKLHCGAPVWLHPPGT
jgi:S-adenosylmethionine hydrolase